MSFARPDLLPFVVLVPLLLAGAVWMYARRRRRIAQAFSDAHLLERLGGASLLRFPRARLLLVTAAGAALAFAAAGPRWGLTEAEGRALSLNIVLAVDISRSMLAEDVEPNRLERARLFGRRLLRELPGDRFGLVVFAGRAYVLAPLTTDHSAIELYLDALDPNMVSQGGSALSAAITQATDLVRSTQASGDRVVVLLSDGEALEEPDAVRAAVERAARAGVRVVTVGIGTPQGANIPLRDDVTGVVTGLRRDEYGAVVVTRLDEEAMRTMASRTGGSYVRLGDAAALSRVVSELRGMQRAEGAAARRVEPRERFALFAGLGVLLLALDAVLAAAGAARASGQAHGAQAFPVGGAAASLPSGGAAAGPAPGGASAARPPGGPAARRRMRTAVLLLVVLAATGFGIGDLERGNRLYRAGRYEEAAAVYERIVADGTAAPQVHYNLGTALLALGRFDDAQRHFESALQGVEPELRQRTFYNLGNRFLEEGRAEGDVQREGALLDAAIEAYRSALRMAPHDVEAKWNLELALREREENEQRQQSMPQQPDPQSGEDDDEEQQQQAEGAGGAAGPSQAPAGEGGDAGTTMDQQPMSQEQADRILSAIEQDERDLTREKLRRGQRETPVLRDW
jgi:Ca-activated chloride channel homolog